MQNIETRHIVYAFMTLLALACTSLSVVTARKKYKAEANQQRYFFKCFIASLACYFFAGFWGGILVFHHDPLTSICKVILFSEVPTYALCFLLMCLLYLLVIIFNAIWKIRQTEEIKDPKADAKGIRRFFEKHKTLSYLLAYTGSFAVIISCVFAVNIFHKQGLIWRIDAKSQYLPYMKYMSDYLREMFHNFSTGNYTIRMYDFNIGMGEDVRSVVRIHPTEFLSVFFNKFQLEKLYNYLMVLRFYLAGLTFACYCRHRGISRRSTLVASFTYIFSGYGLILASKHPIFHSPVIFFPLLLIAMDRLIEKRGYLFFTIMVAISLATNYYFLYMTTIGLGFYALVRFPAIYKTKRIKEFFKMMGRIIFFYLLGVGMSAVFFLPTVIRALNSERVGTVKTMLKDLWRYNTHQEIKLFLSTITGRYSLFDIFLGFAVIFLPALAILFVRKFREHLGLKILILLEFIALSIPAFGLAMSAFSTVTNRWIYMVAMTAAYTIAVTMEDFLTITVPQFLTMLVLAVLYVAGYFYMKDVTVLHLDLQLSMVLLIFTVILLLFIKATHYVTKNQLMAAMLLISTISLTAQGCYLYGNEVVPFSEEFLVTGKEMHEFFEKNEFARFDDDSDTFYRSDVATQRDYYENMPVIFGYNGTSIYNSVINANLVNYMVDMDSIGISAVHRIYNLDGRTSMEELACVKYYQVAAGNDMDIPYGFSLNKERSSENFWVYENQNPLSIGYSYTNIMSAADYADLSPLDKQQTLLQAVVVDPEEAGIHANVSRVENGEIIESSVKISDIDKRLKGSDSYLELINAAGNQGFMLSYARKDMTEKAGFSFSFQRKKGYEVYLKLEDFDTSQQRAKLFLTNDRFNKMLILRNATAPYSLSRNDYFVNLGYCSDSDKETVRLQFCDFGQYTLKDMKLYYLPLKGYTAKVNQLSDDSLENVVMEENTIRGTVHADQDEIMVFSIPYSNGWTAQLDGKDVKLFHANTAYMGLQVPAGNHEIVLSYETPGLRIGAIISAGSILLFLVIGVFRCVLLFVRMFRGKEEL